jgi:hypothetical protein
MTRCVRDRHINQDAIDEQEEKRPWSFRWRTYPRSRRACRSRNRELATETSPSRAVTHRQGRIPSRSPSTFNAMTGGLNARHRIITMFVLRKTGRRGHFKYASGSAGLGSDRLSRGDLKGAESLFVQVHRDSQKSGADRTPWT